MARLGDEAEFEGDAPEHERQQHDDDWQVEGRHDDPIGQRKRHQEPRAAQHEPGLVAVPVGRDGVHHVVALLLRGTGQEQGADAKVEAVEQDIHDHAHAQEAGPHDRKPIGDGLHD